MKATAPFVTLGPSASGPFYRQIYESFRRGILDGRISPGTRLPASRTTQLRHHVGMHSTLDKLRHVMGDFAFAPISDVIAATPVRTVPAAARWAHAK